MSQFQEPWAEDLDEQEWLDWVASFAGAAEGDDAMLDNVDIMAGRGAVLTSAAFGNRVETLQAAIDQIDQQQLSDAEKFKRLEALLVGMADPAPEEAIGSDLAQGLLAANLLGRSEVNASSETE